MSAPQDGPQGGMPIAELAATLEDGTTSGGGRTRTAKALATLFQRTSGPDEARILPYLLQGRLGPPFAAPTLGMDQRRIAQALAQAAQRPEDEVWRLYQQLGGLGITAAQLLGPGHADRATAASRLAVQDDYDRLPETAKAAGRATMQRKATP